MLRGVLSVVAGFITMTVIVMAGTMALMAAYVPGGLGAMKAMRENPSAIPTPTPRYYVMNIALSLVAAIVGGWLTTRIAGTPATGYVIALALVVLAMGLVSAFMTRSGTQPGWYKALIPLIGVAGVAIGGSLTRS